MAWFREWFFRFGKEKQQKEKAKQSPKERYTYRVGGVVQSPCEPSVSILCNETDATWEEETFTELVRKAAGAANNGIWEDNILSKDTWEGEYTQYIIRNDPLRLVFRYHGLLGISVRYDPCVPLKVVLDHLKDQLDIAVDNALFQPLEKKEEPRWQPILAAALPLSVFRRANSALEIGSYIKLLSLLSEKYYRLDSLIHTEPKWEETPRQLQITGAYQHWVGHDDTVSETIEMKFERLTTWCEPDEWQPSDTWPCEGERQYLDESVSEGDRWNYYAMSHKAWLLKKPFGLPDVWSFEYKYVNQR